VLACLVAAGVGGLWLVKNVPGVARLVYGDPDTPTPPATLRPTFTPGAPAPLPAIPETPSPEMPAGMPALPQTPPPELPGATVLPESSPTAGQSTAWPALPLSPAPTMPPPSATPFLPTPAPHTEWLAFETRRGELGDYEIYVMATDGSRQSNLTNSWADDLAPVWSPDGRRIAFVSLRDTVTGKWNLGRNRVYLVDFDPASGLVLGEARALTGGEGKDGWPTWSPDGRQVAFESDRGGVWDIWIINVDGSGLTNLTRSPEDERFPAWSPDGRWMAFTSNRGGNYDLWLLNVEEALGSEGVEPVNLTQNPARDRYAMWSPDGSQIAFNTGRDGNQEIYVMNADGSDPINISRSPDSIEGLADWSPDGRRLVLYSDRPGNKDIFIVNLAGGQWANISPNPASDEFCTWSP